MNLELLRRLKRDKKMTNTELSKASGVPKATLDKITAGYTANPNFDTVCALAAALGCSADSFAGPNDAAAAGPSVLSSEDAARRRRIASLDSCGRRSVQTVIDRMNETVDALIESELLRGEPVPVTADPGDDSLLYYSLPLYDIRISAGTGQFLDSDRYEVVCLQEQPPRGANFMVQVTGDSMEPSIHTGDRLFVRRQPSVERGEVGVFFLDGSIFVKEFWGDRLTSTNPKYDDLDLADYSIVRCYGRVIGVSRE